MITALRIDRAADIHAMLARLPGPDTAIAAAVAAREARLTKPPGSLGRLEEIVAWLALWQGRTLPRMDNPRACVFAGNHGVTEEGVSAFPAAVTAQMVANFEAGGAAVNQLCRAFGVGLTVEALDLDRPVANIARAPAMSEEDLVTAFNRGFAAVPDGADVLCPGEMGIGNTTAAAAIAMGLFGGEAGWWTGPGTGIGGAALEAKAKIVAAAVARHRAAVGDPVEVLRCLGGRELAAMAGAILGARFKRVPVLLDGYVATAAAAVLERAKPGALDHCLAAHRSAEPAHRRLLDALGKEPLLDLGMRLGEASGAVLAVGLLRAACACHGGMATFDQAGVSDKNARD